MSNLPPAPPPGHSPTASHVAAPGPKRQAGDHQAAFFTETGPMSLSRSLTSTPPTAPRRAHTVACPNLQNKQTHACARRCQRNPSSPGGGGEGTGESRGGQVGTPALGEPGPGPGDAGRGGAPPYVRRFLEAKSRKRPSPLTTCMGTAPHPAWRGDSP